METAFSMPRTTASPASLPSEGKKQPEEAPERSLSSRSRAQGGWRAERQVLVDITNDSPIVGLAAGYLKTPSASVGKSRTRAAGKGTPGSGEALLRCQVKTLLQKVDEEAEFVRVVGSEEPPAPFRALLGYLRSPAGLLAPTPANTPQLFAPPGNKEGATIPANPSARKDDDSKVPQVAAIPKEEETPILLHGVCLINRALQFDSPDESEMSDSPFALTCQGNLFLSGGAKKPVADDDCSSAWSMQTNPGSHEEEEEEEEEEDGDVGGGVGGELGADDYYYEGEGEEGAKAEAEGVDALCEGLRMMWVNEERGGLPEFAGKHTRFTYNSDDEMVGEEEVVVGATAAAASPGVLRLRGLPVPEGKHLRFQEEEEEEESP